MGTGKRDEIWWGKGRIHGSFYPLVHHKEIAHRTLAPDGALASWSSACAATPVDRGWISHRWLVCTLCTWPRRDHCASGATLAQRATDRPLMRRVCRKSGAEFSGLQPRTWVTSERRRTCVCGFVRWRGSPPERRATTREASGCGRSPGLLTRGSKSFRVSPLKKNSWRLIYASSSVPCTASGRWQTGRGEGAWRPNPDPVISTWEWHPCHLPSTFWQRRIATPSAGACRRCARGARIDRAAVARGRHHRRRAGFHHHVATDSGDVLRM